MRGNVSTIIWRHRKSKGFAMSNAPKKGTLPCLSRSNVKAFARIILFVVVGVFATFYPIYARLIRLYEQSLSPIITDRNGSQIAIAPNAKGYYTRKLNTIPFLFTHLLIQKEDRFFYYHPGVNPLSVARDLVTAALSGSRGGSSTLTQQLVKTLLGNENERTIRNKFTETAYALALELFASKERILAMYANTAYFGNQAQGLGEASHYYYGVSPEALTERQILELLAALNNPSHRYPGTLRNRAFTASLARTLDVPLGDLNNNSYSYNSNIRTNRILNTLFELDSLGVRCTRNCVLTVDSALTESLREILARNLASDALGGAKKRRNRGNQTWTRQ